MGNSTSVGPMTTPELWVTNDVDVTGDVTSNTVTANGNIAPAQADAASLRYDPTAQQARVVGNGPNPTTVGGVRLDGESSDYSVSQTFLDCSTAYCEFSTPLTVDGDLTVDGTVTANGNTAPAQPLAASLRYDATAQQARVIGNGPNPTTVGGVRLDGESSDYSVSQTYLNCSATLATLSTALEISGNLTATNTNLGSLVVSGTAMIYGNTTLHAPLTATTITATDASLATCEVANSPVRTFANTPDGGGSMVYPPTGIPVSTGTAWGTSLDPTNSFLPLNPPANTVVNAAAGNLTIATSPTGGTGGNIYLGATAPATAIRITPASYGSTLQWQAAKYLATAINLNNLNTLFGNGDFTINNSAATNSPPQFAAQTYIGLFTHVSDSAQFQAAWNYYDTTAKTRLCIRNQMMQGGAWTPWTELLHDDGSGNVAISGNFTAANAVVTNPTTDTTITLGAHAFTLNGTGNVTANAPFYALDGCYVLGEKVANYNVAQSGISLGCASSTQIPQLTLVNSTEPVDQRVSEMVSLAGSTNFRFVSDAGIATSWLIASRSGTTAPLVQVPTAFQATGGVQAGPKLAATVVTQAGVSIGCATTTQIPQVTLVNPTEPADQRVFDIVSVAGSTNLRFLDDTGAGGSWMVASRTGNSCTGVAINAPFTATTKNFRIVHPLDPTKYLNHSSLESPDIAVFYRGEGQTSSGFTTITLPDYFEALTRPEGRTVLLTPLFEDDNESFGMVAAGRVHEGAFRVRSDNPAQRFYWEVKAIRADVDELEIITAIPEDDDDHPKRVATPRGVQ